MHNIFTKPGGYKQPAVVIAAFLWLSGCRQNGHIDAKWLPAKPAETIVQLQPMEGVPADLISMLKDSLPRYYPISIQTAGPVALPVNAYYKPRDRYKADSILGYLQKMRAGNIRIVAAVTGRDISARKGAIDDYGLMGYSYSPGYVCVVSTFRLSKGNPSKQLFQQRLLKTVVHELGHNFGLPHCPNKHCIMADAEGRMSQDKETQLCDECRRKLRLR